MMGHSAVQDRDRIIGWCRQALRFILPVECLACGISLGSDPIPLFCRSCWDLIVPLRNQSCASCDQPFGSNAIVPWTPDHRCQSCLKRPPAFQRAWTLYPYIPPLQNAICALKYRGKIGLADSLADLMIAAIPAQIDVDVIMPVPLHPSRLRAREFNQSLLLADRLARRLRKPVSTTNLIRVRATDPQTTLSRPERLLNLRKAFTVTAPEAVSDRRILVVDDVYTTGATLNECAKVLCDAGASSVYGMTLARTVDASLVPDRIFVERSAGVLPALGV